MAINALFDLLLESFFFYVLYLDQNTAILYYIIGLAIRNKLFYLNYVGN